MEKKKKKRTLWGLKYLFIVSRTRTVYIEPGALLLLHPRQSVYIGSVCIQWCIHPDRPRAGIPFQVRIPSSQEVSLLLDETSLFSILFFSSLERERERLGVVVFTWPLLESHSLSFLFSFSYFAAFKWQQHEQRERDIKIRFIHHGQ